MSSNRHTSFTKILRASLYRKHHGRCHYCNRYTKLPQQGETVCKVWTATVDHLYDAWDLRSHLAQGMHLVVLCCYECNQSRCRERNRIFHEKNYEREHPPFDIRNLLQP